MEAANECENEDIVLSIYPTICQWAWRVFRQAGNDYVHDGLVMLLQQGLPDNRALLFHAWKYKCIDAARHALGDPRRPLGKFGVKNIPMPSLDWERMPGAMPPEVQGETIKVLRRLLQEMPPRTQAILLAWAGGENLKTIAEREGLTQGRVSQIMKRAAPGFKQFHQAESPKGQGKHGLKNASSKRETTGKDHGSDNLDGTGEGDNWEYRKKQSLCDIKSVTDVNPS